MVHTRSRTGCLTCRDDGYKCDEAKPECGRCTRLGKTCKGYGLRVRWKTMDSSAPPSKVAKKRSPRSSKTASQQTSSSSSSPTSTRTSMTAAAEVTAAAAAAAAAAAGPISGTTADLVRNPSYVSPDVSPTTRFLLHHWTSSLASVLSVAAGVVRNPFLEHLTPMMMRSDALLHAVTSMAAGHLGVVLRSRSSSSSSNDDDAALQGLAARHMLAAVSSLRASIQTADTQVSLATILMLQLSDRLLDTDSRIDHLAGARAVIARSGGPAGGVWATGCSRARFLLSLCFHHDVMSSVSRAARPLLSMADDAAPPPLEGLDSLGKLTALVSVVGAISTMQGRSGEAHRQRGWRIKEKLSGVEVDPAGEADIENTIQAYKHAAMVYLYRVWDEGTPPPPPPPKAYHAGRCVDYLLRVPVTSSFVSAHAWPLWTGGCESVDARPRQLVRQRLQQMYEHRHLPSLKRVQQDMEDVWRAKDSQRLRYGTENVDCCKVILYSRKREADLV
ncbi:putative transcriptional regulatory protein [Colletotrichum trifolii]|uniref:Putative transcriptional regulatory protein n=1 Tax=Colletotrichum trifolii TaxID=5466 RepID=A0A4R8RHU9_COLTR|nr:putative transcriptional regulatory protein [Colletotrichum trifolii]